MNIYSHMKQNKKNLLVFYITKCEMEWEKQMHSELLIGNPCD